MVLELKNVTKLYKNGRGAEDISFALASGEVLGLLGPNGSGKTTTMKAIAGLIGITSGSIHVCGIDAVDQHEKAMGHVGCLIESPALYAHTTVLKNLQMAARFYDEVDESRVDEVLRMVEMDKYKNDKIGVLSLGMRQRVGLAGALLSKPSLLILDEPSNGLDIEGMVYVRDTVRQAAESGAAVLISSHLANEIQQVATKAAVMHGGRLLGLLSMNEILEQHGSLEDYFLFKVNEQRQRAGESA
ncbi:MAG: ABC transporter ATP-binding protein [Defluviitaleaceae bacterium]|nr:ABC transporter ATP-binding protein [Defluviitaleaceae bacterium]